MALAALGLREIISSQAWLIHTAGVVGFALVVLWLARPVTTWSWLKPELWLVASGLFLGGIGGHLGLHVITLLIAALLVMRARYSWVLTRRAVWRYVFLIIGAGVIAPLGFELVALRISPVEGWRELAWSQIATSEMTMAIEHGEQVFRFGDGAFELGWGGWEVLLIAGLGIWAMWRRKMNGAERGELVAWCGLIIVLMALPVVFPNKCVVADDIVFLASAWAIYHAARDDNDKRGAPILGTLLPIVTLLWGGGSAYLVWPDLRVHEGPKFALTEPELAADPPPTQVLPDNDMVAPESLPYLDGLVPFVPTFSDGPLDPDARWFGQREGMNTLEVPFEYWRWRPANIRHAKVFLDLSDRNPEQEAPLVVTLLWHREGVFKILAEQIDDVKNTPTITLEGDFPEPGGWVGVVARPIVGSGAGYQLDNVVWLQ